jgi:hypothetical protein
LHNRHSLRRLLVALLSGFFAFFCAVFAAALCVPLPLDRIRTNPVSPFVMDRPQTPARHPPLRGRSEILRPDLARQKGPWLPHVVVGVEDHRSAITRRTTCCSLPGSATEQPGRFGPVRIVADIEP